MSGSLSVGDRVQLSGGYDYEPAWLCGKPHYEGVVTSFIPGQNSNLAAVVQLDGPITVEDTTGNMVVLELRHVGADWKDTETVHVELCDFVPEARSWQQRRQGKWVESHATYRRSSNTR